MDLSSISDLISPNGIHKEVIFNHGGKVGAKAVKKKVGHSYYSYELYCGVQLLKFDFKNGLGRYLNSNENGRLFSMRMDNALYCVIGFCIIRNTVPMLRIVDFYEGLFCKNPTVVKTYLEDRKTNFCDNNRFSDGIHSTSQEIVFRKIGKVIIKRKKGRK